MRTFLQQKKIRPMLVILLFWAVMAASRTSLLHLFPAGGNSGDMAVSIVVVLLIAASFLFAFFIGDNLPRNFLLIALLIGLFYVVITKFAYCTDEEYHFQRAFSITNGDFMPVWLDGQTGVYVPKGYSVFADTEAWSLANFFQNADLTAPVRELIFFARARSASYLPFGYLPSALGIGVGRLMHLPLALDIVLGRLTNFLFYVLVCWYAIKRTTRFRTVLFLTAVIPTCLEMAGILTTDSTLIACSLLFLSICLHYSFDEIDGRISAKDIVLLALSAGLILSIKYMGYLAVVVLVAFLPKQRVKNKCAALLAVGGAFLVIAALQVWALVAFSGSLDDAIQSGASVSGQLSFILHHPAAFLKVLALDLMSNLVNRLHFFIDNGSMSLNFLAEPLALLPIFGALLAKDKPELSLRQKTGWSALWLGCALVTVLLSTAALYISFTPVGETFVKGMQNRYVLPVIALAYLPMALLPIENKIQNWERTLSLLAGLTVVNILAGKLVELLAL
ncbi:MAG TPA: DUF2142 domain-containing protein [Candidatus Cryosericum sp.]|nr:DUF2142 domain-containing protein [Candidatus Cryosericum sp.]